MITDEIWVAEFRGFFWGEGCLDLTPFTRKGAPTTSYTPRVRIGVNQVDRRVLEEFQSVFGGSLFVRTATDSVTWQLTGKDKINAVVKCLDGGRLPAAKALQLDTFKRALSLIPVRGQVYTPEIRAGLIECKLELERLKRVRVEQV